MKKRIVHPVRLLVLALVVAFGGMTCSAEEYAVVANRDNPVTGSKDQIKGLLRQLFLKKQTL